MTAPCTVSVLSVTVHHWYRFHVSALLRSTYHRRRDSACLPIPARSWLSPVATLPLISTHTAPCLPLSWPRPPFCLSPANAYLCLPSHLPDNPNPNPIPSPRPLTQHSPNSPFIPILCSSHPALPKYLCRPSQPHPHILPPHATCPSTRTCSP